VKTLSRFYAGLAMMVAAGVADLLGGIAALCYIPLAHIDGVVPGETLDPCDPTLAAPWCLCLWGWTSVSGTSGRRGLCIEASMATMVVPSDVRDVALVEVVGSFLACPWVCLVLFVALKSKLWWRVPGSVR
jgi:hypothetical protein